MEDFFNLPDASPEEPEIPEISRTKEELMVEAKEIYSSLTMAEKVDMALPTVGNVDVHDAEMDAIASRAKDTFEELLVLGGNVPDLHAGKIYEVAGQMLKTALEAKNAKAERKLKMIELQIKKLRIDQIDPEEAKNKQSDNTFDRNMIMKYIVDSAKPTETPPENNSKSSNDEPPLPA